MNNSTISLKQLITDVELHLMTLGYAQSTINRYKSCWKKILKRCNTEGINEFSYELCMSLIREEYNIPTSEKLKGHHIFCLRTTQGDGSFVLFGIKGCDGDAGISAHFGTV